MLEERTSEEREAMFHVFSSASRKAAECRVKSRCQECPECGARQHTSICDKTSDQVLLATGDRGGGVMHPIVIIVVYGVQCRALLDTGLVAHTSLNS